MSTWLQTAMAINPRSEKTQAPTARLLWVILISLFGAAGCVSSRAFIPGEHVTGLSPRDGHYAAEYTVRDASHVIADIKVWSRGAHRDGSDAPTIVHVGFEVDNPGEHAVRLEPKQLYLDDVRLRDGALDRTPPLRIEGDTLIPPGEEREIQVSFSLPGDVWPSDVLNYRVAWRLTNGGVYVQKTPFLRAADPRAVQPLYPYYPYYGYSTGYWGYPYRPFGYRRYYPGWPYRPFP